MLFKNITAFKAEINVQPDILHEDFMQHRYTPIMDTEICTVGWVSPSDDDKLVRNVSGSYLMTLAIEKRTIPSSVVKKELGKRADAFENENGFYPGKRALKELKELVIDELIPKAFPIMKKINIIVRLAEGLLLIDSASNSDIDEIIKMILRSTQHIKLESFQFKQSPSVKMLEWVRESAPDDFTVDDSITLESSVGKVKFIEAEIDSQELEFRVGQGYIVTELGMTYVNSNDQPISFMLTSNFSIRGIKYDNSIAEKITSSSEDFEGNVMIAASEMKSLVTNLLSVLDPVLNGVEDLV